MKKTKAILIMAIAALVVITAACKKSSNSTSKSTNLTRSAWKWSSIKQTGIEIIQDCEKDNTETYTANTGTYSFNKGADDCSASEDNYVGTWKLLSDTKIVYDITDTANIITLDENTFSYSYTDEPDLVYTYKH